MSDDHTINQEIRAGEETQARLAEGIAASAAGILALVLAARAFGIAEDASEKEYDVRERIFEIQTKYINHWETIEFPQKTLVCGEIYSLEAPVADYNDINTRITAQADALSQGAQLGITTINIKNRVDCEQRGCTNDAQMMGPIVAVQASYYIFRHQERRFYEVDDTYRKLAASTHRGLEMKPDQAFSLMGNATSLYSIIGSSAMNVASGSASASGSFFGLAGGSSGGT